MGSLYGIHSVTCSLPPTIMCRVIALFLGADSASPSASAPPAVNITRCPAFFPCREHCTLSTGTFFSPARISYGFCAEMLRATLYLPGVTFTSCPKPRRVHNITATSTPAIFIEILRVSDFTSQRTADQVLLIVRHPPALCQ